MLADRIVGAWNRWVDSLDKPCRVKPVKGRLPRASLANARGRRGSYASDDEFLKALETQLRRLGESPYHLGANDLGWVATLPWLLKLGPWQSISALARHRELLERISS